MFSPPTLPVGHYPALATSLPSCVLWFLDFFSLPRPAVPDFTGRCLGNLSEANARISVVFLQNRKQHLRCRDALIQHPRQAVYRPWVRENSCGLSYHSCNAFPKWSPLGQVREKQGSGVERASPAARGWNIISLSL